MKKLVILFVSAACTYQTSLARTAENEFVQLRIKHLIVIRLDRAQVYGRLLRAEANVKLIVVKRIDVDDLARSTSRKDAKFSWIVIQKLNMGILVLLFSRRSLRCSLLQIVLATVVNLPLS